jgi:hypothetical protein
MNGEVNIALDRNDFLVVFPLRGEKRARLVGTIRDDNSFTTGNLTWDDISRHVLQRLQIDVQQVNWFSTYRVHHRVAEHFRGGRAFLLGDAAHVHSPVGGQGMNTGIGDAVNLAWKLAAVLRGAHPALLETYETERIGFARHLIETTDQAFTQVTSSQLSARMMRMQLAPLFGPLFFSFPSARRFVFRTVSQTAIHYRHSPLSKGIAGAIHGGDRLPWVKLSGNGDALDNFAPLRSLDWQVHVYGESKTGLRAECERRGLPLHLFPYTLQARHVRLRRNAAYLLRPDGYVALAEPDGNPEPVASFLDARAISPLRAAVTA